MRLDVFLGDVLALVVEEAMGVAAPGHAAHVDLVLWTLHLEILGELVGQRLGGAHDLLLPALLRAGFGGRLLARDVPTGALFKGVLSLVRRFDANSRGTLTVLGDSPSNHGACSHQAMPDIWLLRHLLIDVGSELSHWR